MFRLEACAVEKASSRIFSLVLRNIQVFACGEERQRVSPDLVKCSTRDRHDWTISAGHLEKHYSCDSPA